MRSFVSGFLCLLALLLASPLNAQDLTINVTAGFGGYYRPGRWCPVTVSIDNRPKSGKPGDRDLDYSGTLVIESESMDREPIRFTRQVEVPGFSSQRFTVLAKFPESPLPAQPTVKIRNENGRLLQEVPIDIQPLKKSQVLLVTISEELRRLRYPLLRQAELYPIVQAPLDPREMASHWAGYDSIDVLVVPSWPQNRITSFQAEALRDWVAMGGTLVFLGGAGTSSYGATVPEGLLPVETSESTRFQVGGPRGLEPTDDEGGLVEGEVILVSKVDRVAEAATVVFASNDAPILIREAHGKGQILFLTLDLETLPRELREALTPYWMGMMPVRSLTDWEYEVPETLAKFTTLEKARPPNVVLIILICIVYTILVGPVNFVLLSRANKVQLAWFTVPAIVLTFSVLIYVAGMLTKGGSTVARELTLLESVSGEAVFAERSFISIFVPSAGDYEAVPVKEPQTVADTYVWHDVEMFRADSVIAGISRAASTGGGALGLTDTTPEVDFDGSVAAVDRWPLRTFDTTQFEVRGPREMPGGINGQLRFRAPNSQSAVLSGEIANATGLNFVGSALFLGGRGIDLGPWKASESRSFAEGDLAFLFTGARSTATEADALTMIEKISPAALPETDEQVGRRNAKELLLKIFRPYSAGDILPPMNGKCVFIGIAEDPELSVSMNLERDAGIRTTVLIVEMDLVLSAGRHIIPSAIVDTKLVDYPTDRSFTIEGEYGSLMRLDRPTDVFLTIGLPFRQPGLDVRTVMNNVLKTDENNYAIDIGIYDQSGSQFLSMTNSSSIGNTGGQVISMPYSGRSWILFKGTKKNEDQNTFIGGNGTVQDIRFLLEAYRN
ncbi:MAG: hypothetical protein RLY93_16575 [Sumerlaeia bacterium]